MRIHNLITITAMAFVAFANDGASLASPPPGYHLVWSDEFNGPIGSLPSDSEWSYQIGPNGANGEQEVYVRDAAHSSIVADRDAVDGRALDITATSDYKSARMSTKRSFEYGYIESRMKLPYGQGIWPAFWMLGDSISTVGWPQCGEIDIMENLGKASWAGHVQATLHQAGNMVFGNYTLPNGQVFRSEYHVFGCLWTKSCISFYVDNHLYRSCRPAEINSGAWPYNAPFFILLNLAVGGGWPGNPDATTHFPQHFLVDYVRVYSGTTAKPTPPKGVAARPSDKEKRISLSWSDSPSATSYDVYRGSARGSESLYRSDINASNFTDWNVTGGQHFWYSVVAVNDVGRSARSVAVSGVGPRIVEEPYGGKPWPIPGMIACSNYDTGGEGVSYHSNDEVNHGGQYRPSDGVSLESCSDAGGGFDVCYTGPGQWLNYTVNVARAGTYSVGIRTASQAGGGSITILDGKGRVLAGSIRMPPTGGWQTFTTVTATVSLRAGKQVLRVLENTQGFNLNTLTFTLR